MLRGLLPIILAALTASVASAQTVGTLDPQPLPPLANPTDLKVAAKELFGRKGNPVPIQARAIGF